MKSIQDNKQLVFAKYRAYEMHLMSYGTVMQQHSGSVWKSRLSSGITTVQFADA